MALQQLPETFSALVVDRELQAASSGRPTSVVTSHVVTDTPLTSLPLDGVTVRVAFSALTYADALCVLGKDAGARDYPSSLAWSPPWRRKRPRAWQTLRYPRGRP